ncbi:hypothetical protein [Oceanobacillus jeddahense]|uniref:Uncharacterized protein n=1 Tax=Oceanobacillus jeddahense TaxID=1462527 RepID=A0ABY5JZU9_9BACI|nr:hypothetical protein [Oceanobacillus jeddahense]UUI04932.1 hypothetical protein NP439_09970 [Oceanobacillus jeddahense]
MNYKVLKDGKAVLGFISSIILVIIAFVLVTNHIRYWVLFSVTSMIVLTLSLRRADKIIEHLSASDKEITVIMK